MYLKTSVSDLDPDSNGLADPDWESRSGSRQAKEWPKRGKKFEIFMFVEFSVWLEASPAARMSFKGV
jgi:hypothetical protein